MALLPLLFLELGASGVATRTWGIWRFSAAGFSMPKVAG
jgi:hypothetical protein